MTQNTITLSPGPRSGRVTIPPSKSRAHRLLICAAFSAGRHEILCRGISRDIQATADCLRAMGAEIGLLNDRRGYLVTRSLSEILSSSAGTKRSFPGEPASRNEILLPCGESGSTLRFLLPVLGALGLPAVFNMEGRLPERPIQPLADVLSLHGMRITQDSSLLHCSGALRPGRYSIPGNISSQYISGLLFALPLLCGNSELEVTGEIQSADYTAMTEDALRLAGFHFEKKGSCYRIPGNQTGSLPASLTVESDWSSAAFFLCLGALSSAGVTVCGMNQDSLQGDRAVLDLLADFGATVRVDGQAIHVRSGELKGQVIDASSIPDLVPVLCVVAAAAQGTTRIRHAERLRLKETDRLKTTVRMLSALGADIHETEDGMIIEGKPGTRPFTPCLQGGEVSSFRDHRIAMSAAVAASVCRRPVTVLDAQCTEKSFPGFWETFSGLDCVGGTDELKHR